MSGIDETHDLIGDEACTTHEGEEKETAQVESENTSLIATPTRRRKRKPKSQVINEQNIVEFTDVPRVTVSMIDQSGKKEKLASSYYEDPKISPLIKRRNWSSSDLREYEGETIVAEKPSKQKRRRKRKSKKPFEQLAVATEPVIPTPEEEAREEIKYEEEINCLTARTSLILPFSWKSSTVVKKSAMEWIHQLRERRISDSNGKKIFMWAMKETLPGEISDFTPQFRQILGWKEGGRSASQTWSCQRLMLNPEAVSLLLKKSQFVTIQNEQEVSYDADIEAVELLVYPMGSAILVFHINWIPSRKLNKFTLDDARTAIFAAKYRHKVKGLCLGWNFFNNNPSGESPQDLEWDSSSIFTKELFEAKYFPDKTVSLAVMGNWLLVEPNESDLVRPLDHARHAYHHSAIVIDRDPSNETLQVFLFHLRHAYGQKNRPPPDPQYHLGSVLVPRMNRHIGISREGTVCISWPTNIDDPNDFELLKWHRKFQGIYLLLALHAHGEKAVLYELGELAAAQAENLNLVSFGADFEEMKQSRQRLRELAALMVRYTLSMSSDDCGGSSEYTEFFTTLRKVFGIPELRAELSQELKDVLAVVEANYLEEERRQRDETEAERRQNREVHTAMRLRRDRQDQEFGVIISIFGAFTLPFVLISGIFGMNLDDLPVNVRFWPLLGITFAISILCFSLLILWRYRTLKKNSEDEHASCFRRI